ncbi:hypothetical protein EDWATA_02763 [Edwardsiella tarda ATCC 23685]|uniref:Uncharacterized protein n=1 Tax=Edwardsiella tarda ATCC 23685 TaxID=500638 RepID=D4F7M7_EDWTA|nr:hypothetical protein EDWATA_02763 [Edwardsiella tarda ATCC 23685]
MGDAARGVTAMAATVGCLGRRRRDFFELRAMVPKSTQSAGYGALAVALRHQGIR